ncbi:exodeoxyribonuclease V subunit gamma [Cellulomonas sp. APG4]|nr:exodeoxyribonuclease V subunit gamma [Cellulomonas sp. APG4]
MLQLHRSERADTLVVPLAGVLARALPDPFAPDVVAVPTRGVERWLAQRLSHHLGAADGEAGITANIRFDPPERVLDDAVHAALGTARTHDDDPWSPERLTWHVLTTIDACAHEPWCSPLGRHLGAADDDVRRGRRVQVTAHLARLFRAYGTQRPSMVDAWARGLDEDGTGAPLPPDLTWQAELWRRVRDAIGETSPAELMPEALRALDEHPDVVDLPERLSVFGPTRLPEHHLQVLAALARHREVHLWLPHPSPALWERVAAVEPPGDRRRAAREPVAAHPLLASMARDATELQVRLTGTGAQADEHHPAPEPPATLLGTLQRRLRDDDVVSPPAALAPHDRSVQVHACHGRSRQVEVLREALLGLFADHPDLEPRDVVVLCPDVEAFAPLLTATFGALPEGPGHDVHPGRTLRVRLADRSLRQTNPVLAMLSRLLELPDGRVTASDVIDLAASPPVRRRFRLDDDELARLRTWAVTSGVRWGEDRSRRERFGLGQVGQGTWETGLDRLLLGVAMAEEDHRFLGAALPLDDVDSTDVDLAGRVAELVDRLARVLDLLDGPHGLEDWLGALDHAIDLLADAAPADGWQLTEARRTLADVREHAQARSLRTPLRLADVRALLARRLEGRPTRAGFRTGALTVCALEPMRAVPHRVVCLLGMDDGAFPRGARTDGDDVLLRAPLIGERDRRSEDRQLFLDAVTSAGEHLVVLYSGAHERTGAELPPAVPVGELLDALDRTADGARAHVVVQHPLQPVDERAFTPDALGRPGPFSFDTAAYRAALAGRERPVESASRTHPDGAGPADGAPVPPRLSRANATFLPAPLAPPEATSSARAPEEDDAPDVVDLDALVRDLEHPVRAFLRTRLGVVLPGEIDDVEDALPVTLDGLGTWQIGDRLLNAALAGADLDRAVQAEWRRGEVPPRALGHAVLTEVRERIAPIVAAADPFSGPGPAHAVDVDVELPDGRRVTGTVPGVHDDVLLRAVYSRLSPKHRLRAWVQLLALAASDPAHRYRAVTVGRSQGRAPRAAVARLDAPSSADATRHLGELVALRDQALREPLPMPVETACAYATARAAATEEVQALDAARTRWKDGFERTDEYHVEVWGPAATLDDVAGTPSEAERAWWPEEGTRLGVLARRVWEPVITHEDTETA